MESLVNVFLIGAQKSGTTTLAYLLDQHSKIEVCRPKEPHYFTHHFKKGTKWYHSLFPNHPKSEIFIDASTSYTMADTGNLKFEGVPEKIYKYNPNAKFIYILREPVERAYSGYWHAHRNGRINKSFSESILDKDFQHLVLSDYNSQLNKYKPYFEPSNILLITFEELKENYQDVVNKCCVFLDLDVEYVKLNSVKNKSHSANKFAREIRKINNRFPLLTKIRNFLPRKVVKSIRKLGLNKSIPSMKDSDREYLKNYFRSRNDELNKHYDINIDQWGDY
ncbi:sulfotransferase family protein [Halobacillus sp. SY10]|uniref:sulfotransferase family protein n=1 Tax=Halobacillus sp. SY10 TaxID=3381356 RepID=UPI003879309B